MRFFTISDRKSNISLWNICFGWFFQILQLSLEQWFILYLWAIRYIVKSFLGDKEKVGVEKILLIPIDALVANFWTLLNCRSACFQSLRMYNCWHPESEYSMQIRKQMSMIKRYSCGFSGNCPVQLPNTETQPVFISLSFSLYNLLKI